MAIGAGAIQQVAGTGSTIGLGNDNNGGFFQPTVTVTTDGVLINPNSATPTFTSASENFGTGGYAVGNYLFLKSGGSG